MEIQLIIHCFNTTCEIMLKVFTLGVLCYRQRKDVVSVYLGSYTRNIYLFYLVQQSSVAFALNYMLVVRPG